MNSILLQFEALNMCKKKQIIFKISVTCFLLLMFSCTEKPGHYQPANFPDEIIYHVFQRSFYDSNGDGIGDLNGLTEKLDYLQELGVTSLLLLPLYNSVFYHNYFPTDFETIDPEFGTKEDYFNLVSEVHRRGMKIYMDMEVQYITEDHLWYKDSYKNPSSPYTDYLIYNGPGNTQPESIVWDLTELLSYDGTIKKVTTLNLLGEKYQNYIHGLFKYWVDPNKDGNFEDGVDGFRIDHMMNDLDWKGKITGLFSALWKPLFDELRTINPEIKIMGEQANWGTDYGQEYYDKGGIDLVFAFGLNSAIKSFNKREIINKYDSTLLYTPEGKYQILFIENSNDHLITFLRWNESQKILAALNLSGEKQEADLSVRDLPKNGKPKKFLFGTSTQDLSSFGRETIKVKLDPYGIRVWLLK
jgi:alpha-amylase